MIDDMVVYRVAKLAAYASTRRRAARKVKGGMAYARKPRYGICLFLEAPRRTMLEGKSGEDP